MRQLPAFCLLFWLTLTGFPARSQEYSSSVNDSSQQVMLASKSASSQVSRWRHLADSYLRRPEPILGRVDSAAKYAVRALLLSTTLPNRILEAKCLATLERVYVQQDDSIPFKPRWPQLFFADQIADPHQQARLWLRLADSYQEVNPQFILALERALALFRLANDREQTALALRYLADVHQQQGKYAQALEELMQVKQIQRATNSRERHGTYHILSHIYYRLGIYEQALPYALASIQSARATADTTSLYAYYHQTGMIYSELGQTQQCLHYFQLLVTKLQHEKGPTPFLLAGVNQVNKALLQQNRPQEALAYHLQMLRNSPPKSEAEKGISAYGLALIYLKLRAYAPAEKYLLATRKMAEIPNQDLHTFVFLANLQLCQLYAERKQYTTARSYLTQSIQFAALSPKLRTQAQLQAFKLDSMQGNLVSALRHYQQYQAITDSIFNEKKSNQLLGFQVRYETQQKEQALRLKEKSIALLTQQSNAQRARLSQRQTLRNALLGGTGLLALLLGLGLNRYRLKQRSNLQLKAHQEEISHKNQHLSDLLQAQDSLLTQKDQLLVEKEWLLKEIYHRVKNNLQLVMSLLDSQAASLQDGAALVAIQESQHRVQAMALIHQKLYQGENVARIFMPAYVHEVADYLHESYQLPQRIQLKVDIDSIELDVTQAVPLGLIINEALTNAYKYAFPQGRVGTISISLHCLKLTTYVLTIADDGVGLPANFEPVRSRSLGMTLLHGFSKQLDGELCLISPPGLIIRLVFAREYPIHFRS